MESWAISREFVILRKKDCISFFFRCKILYVIFLNIKQSHTLIRPEYLLKPFIQGGKGQRCPSKIYLFIENVFKFLEKSNYSGGIWAKCSQFEVLCFVLFE